MVREITMAFYFCLTKRQLETVARAEREETDVAFPGLALFNSSHRCPAETEVWAVRQKDTREHRWLFRVIVQRLIVCLCRGNASLLAFIHLSYQNWKNMDIHSKVIVCL